MRIVAIIVALIGILACGLVVVVGIDEFYEPRAIAEIGVAIASVGIIAGAFLLLQSSK